MSVVRGTSCSIVQGKTNHKQEQTSTFLYFDCFCCVLRPSKNLKTNAFNYVNKECAPSLKVLATCVNLERLNACFSEVDGFCLKGKNRQIECKSKTKQEELLTVLVIS